MKTGWTFEDNLRALGRLCDRDGCTQPAYERGRSMIRAKETEWVGWRRLILRRRYWYFCTPEHCALWLMDNSPRWKRQGPHPEKSE